MKDVYGKHFREFKINVLRETGKQSPSLSGLRMGGMKLCVTYEEGKGNWRAYCIRCGGAERFDNMTAGEVGFTPIQDRHGRGEVCFLCQGMGKIVLPSPEAYGRLLSKWSVGASKEEVLDAFESELNYVEKVMEMVGAENVSWQDQVMQQWDTVLTKKGI